LPQTSFPNFFFNTSVFLFGAALILGAVLNYKKSTKIALIAVALIVLGIASFIVSVVEAPL
jgi:hypothetical protein